MLVREAMTRDVHIANPDETIREVAKLMADEDIGFLPVGENDRLVGMITDRDIVVRGVALGKNADDQIRDVMTADVKYCFEDEAIDHVVMNMGDQKIRRLPVVDRNKRLVGVISLADAARSFDPEVAGIALSGVAEPGGL
ncbi:MAG: CBS domain-containing protein, partial [Methylobacteriaceae bacterium]|nr:CBS domain-containing protein [Methylobacteriaceae bacterium]